MARLVLTIETNMELAKTILTRGQYFFYVNRMKALLLLIKSQLRKFDKIEDNKEVKKYQIENDLQTVEKEFKELNDFYFMDMKEFNKKHGKYSKYFNDRILRRLIMKAIKNVMASTPLDCLNALGIAVKTEIFK